MDFERRHLNDLFPLLNRITNFSSLHISRQSCRALWTWAKLPASLFRRQSPRVTVAGQIGAQLAPRPMRNPPTTCRCPNNCRSTWMFGGRDYLIFFGWRMYHGCFGKFGVQTKYRLLTEADSLINPNCMVVLSFLSAKHQSRPRCLDSTKL